MLRELVALILATIGTVTVAVHAQETYLEGHVTSQDGKELPDAEFIAVNQRTARSLTGLTDAEGTVILHLPVGTYRLEVVAQDFHPTHIDDVELHVAIPSRVDIPLEPCTHKDCEPITVSFSETQATINTSNAELTTLVNRRQVLELPLNGRNPIQLASLQAGVVTNTTLTEAVINGLRGTYNNITQDGINIQDSFLRTEGLRAVTAPSVENVLEFSMVTQNSAVNSGLGVSQISLVTPSGANNYHGSAFYFHRNTVFNANSFFNNAVGLDREVLLRHQFGARLGGPILRDKLFFFGYYEGTQEAQETSLLRSVLTQSAREGLFRYQSQNSGEPEEINLFTFTPMDVDPVMKELLNRTPLPNASFGDLLNTAGFRFNSRRPRTVDLGGLRLDYTLGPHDRLAATYSQAGIGLPRGFQNVGFGEDIGERFPGLEGGGHESVRRFGALAWHTDLGFSVSNNLRWGVQRSVLTSFNRENAFVSVDGRKFQVNFPLVENPIQNFLEVQRKTLLYELGDNVTWSRQGHNLHFGGHFRHARSALRDSHGTLPVLTLGFGRGTANPLASGDALFPGGVSTADRQRATDLLSLLTGVRDSFGQTFTANSRTSGLAATEKMRALRQRFLSFYAGDRWRLRQNLTLNLGLRWEWHTTPTETGGLALLPVGGLESLRNPFAMIDFAGEGTGRRLFDDDLNNFAPQVGLAWDPFGDGRTVVRAGYRVSYVIDNSLSAVFGAVDANPGLSVNQRAANLSGTVSSEGVPPVEAPLFQVPRTLPDQLALSPFNGLFTIDPNFRTPYVQQWTMGLSRQIFRDTTLEVRYVGNHAVKLGRAIDLNQPDFLSNGFLEDFQRARVNLERTGNPFLGQALEIFPLLADRGQTLLLDPAVQEMLDRGEIGELLFFMFQNQEQVFGTGGVGIPAAISRQSFFPNYNALFTSFLGNNSFSTYHGFQAEVRRRLSQGLYWQANYTFSKVLTDFSGSADNLAPLLDIRQPELDRRRANFDVSHVFNGNFLWELPLSQADDDVIAKILTGWQVSGIVRWQSGPPISIISGRGTFARRENSLNNTIITDLTQAELKKNTGEFRLPNGAPVLFGPLLIQGDGGPNRDLLRNPEAGQVGTLGLTPVAGPGLFNFDLSLIKRIRVHEELGLEFRAEFFNFFNNVNWRVPRNPLGEAVQNINDVNFARILDTFDPRIIQFALKLEF